MIGYEELRFYWLKGLRNGNLSKLSGIQKSYYRVCLMFARRVGRIASDFVVSQLRAIMNSLVEGLKLKALKRGLERADELKARFERSGVFKWAPRVIEWLKDKSYILYLGFMEIYSPPRFAW